MVRIKHRYLLAHILYPDTSPSALPPGVQFRPPTPNDLTPQLLLRAIREQVTLLYGDYGAGVTAAGLSSKRLLSLTPGLLPRHRPRVHPRFPYYVGLCACANALMCLPYIVKYLSPATSTFILRCPRAHYQLVWAALTYMTHLPVVKTPGGEKALAGKTMRGGDYGKTRSGDDQRPCVIRVVRVSGTVRKAEEEAVRRARGDILRARRGEVGGGGLDGWFAGVEDGEGGIVDVDEEEGGGEEGDEEEEGEEEEEE
ncbi:hypothetical protein MMC27_004582 [Xylographa pallens]|nr:hypothetical protein [Xylographa pallens]